MNKMNGLDVFSPVSFSPSEHNLTQAVILYENETTHRWAEEVYSRLAASDPTSAIRATWWNLGYMSQPGILAGAVSTAIRADLLVIATSCEHGLPLPFYVWASAWLPNRRRAGGSLLALLDTTEHGDHNPPPILNYLQTLSGKAGLGFFCEQRSTDKRASGLVTAKAFIKRNGNSRMMRNDLVNAAVQAA